MQRIILLPLKLLSFGLVLGLIFQTSVWASCSRGESYFHFLVAEYLLAQGRLVEARKELEKTVKCDRKALFPRKELMKVYAEGGSYEKAISLAKEILKDAPDDKEVLFILAKLYWAQKRYARAIETLEVLLEKYPDYEEALSVLASIYLQKKDLQGAIDTLERLAAKNPENAAIFLELARLYRRQGDFEKAKRYYEKALSLNPHKETLYLEYGEFLEKIGAFAEAEKVYRQGLQKTSQAFHLYEALLRLYIRQEQFKKALSILEAIEKEIGSNPRLLLRKALIYLDLNQNEEAAKLLEKLLREDPQNYTALFYLGVALEKLGKKEEAIKAYEAIPPQAEVFTLAVRRLAQLLNDPQEVYKLFEKALSQHPDDRNLYLLAGSIFEELDACSLGEPFVRKGFEKFPEDVDLAVALGLLLICEGKEQEAIKLLEPLLEKYPQNPTLLNFIGYTYADLNENLSKAERYIRKALSLKPDDGYIIDSLAWVYYRKGQYQKALEEIKRALKLSPNDPTIHEHYGDILMALGKEKEALSVYRKALSLAKKGRDRKRLKEKIQKLCAKFSCSSF